jgi:glycerophosphoryl diester phosphodiesterase
MTARVAPPACALHWLVARPIAHRGLHDKSRGIIENTASAFAGAIAGGYAIECDLQLTADGEAVVFHDERLERLTHSQGSVKDHTAAQMKTMSIRGSGDRVQTLAELLAQVAGQVPLLIELKSHWDHNDALVRCALDVLQDYRGPHGLMSFDPGMIEAVRRCSPETARGMVADRAFDPFYDSLPLERRQELRSLSHLERSQPHFLSYYFRELPYAPVTELRQQGFPVISWTIRSPEQAAVALRHSDQVTFEGFRP